MAGVKVCIVTHAYPRFEGDWRANFIESLARAYARNKADVTVFVPYAVEFNRALINTVGVKIVQYRYAPWKSLHTLGYARSMKDDLSVNVKNTLMAPFLLLAGVVQLSILLKKENFDLIHAHWAMPNSAIALVARFFSRSRAKVFTSFPGSDVTLITRLGLIGRMYAMMVSRSDYLSCNSSDLKEELVKTGIEPGKIDFVIYGVDPETIAFSAPERIRLRRIWQVSEEDAVLLMVGRFVPKKGFITAMEALDYIVKRKKNVTLVVVGNGPQKNKYLEILNKDGTQSHVRFAGEIPTGELRNYYSACDIFLMPSRRLPSDGLNVVVPEAMACGRAIVASKVGGNDLVVFPGINGYLVDENDPLQLADAVVNLIEHPGLAREMGDHSLRLVRERFNWDAIAKYYLERYVEHSCS
jgi:glycosyltransferase involved in cell wall biosynthesis